MDIPEIHRPHPCCLGMNDTECSKEHPNEDPVDLDPFEKLLRLYRTLLQAKLNYQSFYKSIRESGPVTLDVYQLHENLKICLPIDEDVHLSRSGFGKQAQCDLNDPTFDLGEEFNCSPDFMYLTNQKNCEPLRRQPEMRNMMQCEQEAGDLSRTSSRTNNETGDILEKLTRPNTYTPTVPVPDSDQQATSQFNPVGGKPEDEKTNKRPYSPIRTFDEMMKEFPLPDCPILQIVPVQTEEGEHQTDDQEQIQQSGNQKDEGAKHDENTQETQPGNKKDKRKKPKDQEQGAQHGDQRNEEGDHIGQQDITLDTVPLQVVPIEDDSEDNALNETLKMIGGEKESTSIK